MHFYWGILGTLIIAAITIDIIWTTLTVKGWGPISGKFFSQFINPKLKKSRKSIPAWRIAISGPGVVLLTFTFWMITTWAGWVMIFSSAEFAVLQADSGLPANLFSRIYFSGYTLTTLGIGDYLPGSDFWQLLTVFAAVSGFFILSLAISYLIPVLGQVVQSKRLAFFIYSLGHTPESILINHWNGRDFSHLVQHLFSLAPMLTLLGQQYLAYPVLFFFHSTDYREAISLRISALDDAISLLAYGVQKQVRPEDELLKTIRISISHFMEVFSVPKLKMAEEVPPVPDLKSLKEAGIPTLSDNDFKNTMNKLADHRRMLYAFVQHESWEWDFEKHTSKSDLPLI
ncbi:MAG: potassium channel family protein [Calditrichia bacterium]